MQPKPLDHVCVALGEVAGPAGRDQVFTHRQAAADHRQHMIQRVGSLAAVRAAALPGVEDAAA
jgi:hypothetical protein